MEAVIRWKVVTSKAFYWGKRIMKPGQIFSAPESAIPKEFRLWIIPLDQIPESTKQEEKPIIPSTVSFSDTPAPVVYRLKQRDDTYNISDGDGMIIGVQPYYDVVASTGKVVNEKPLTEKDAKTMIRKLK
jgi:hypothetical protein